MGGRYGLRVKSKQPFTNMFLENKKKKKKTPPISKEPAQLCMLSLTKANIIIRKSKVSGFLASGGKKGRKKEKAKKKPTRGIIKYESPKKEG